MSDPFESFINNMPELEPDDTEPIEPVSPEDPIIEQFNQLVEDGMQPGDTKVIEGENGDQYLFWLSAIPEEADPGVVFGLSHTLLTTYTNLLATPESENDWKEVFDGLQWHVVESVASLMYHLTEGGVQPAVLRRVVALSWLLIVKSLDYLDQLDGDQDDE